MTSLDLIAAALPPAEPPEPTQPGLCCVTGAQRNTLPRHYAIRESFTNLDLLRAPESDRISLAAWRVLTYALPPAEGKKRGAFPLIQSSWLCDGDRLEFLKRADVRARVLTGVSAPRWCGYVTTSYKKHGALRTPINSGGSQFWLFEQTVVDCSDRAEVTAVWQRLRQMQESGFPRPVLESLEPSLPLLSKTGLAVWLDFEPWARARYLSPLYQFLCYLLPSQEELKGVSPPP